MLLQGSKCTIFSKMAVYMLKHTLYPSLDTSKLDHLEGCLIDVLIICSQTSGRRSVL